MLADLLQVERRTLDVVSPPTEALADWHAMFDERFAAPDSDAGLELPTLPPDGRDEEFGYEEFEECVLSMKSGKAPGPDEIPVEFFRNSPAACHMLFRLCTKIWVAEEVPKDFVLGLVCMVHKKGAHDMWNVDEFGCGTTLATGLAN